MLWSGQTPNLEKTSNLGPRRTPAPPCLHSCTSRCTWCPRRWWGAPRCSSGGTPWPTSSRSSNNTFAPVHTKEFHDFLSTIRNTNQTIATRWRGLNMTKSRQMHQSMSIRHCLILQKCFPFSKQIATDMSCVDKGRRGNMDKDKRSWKNTNPVGQKLENVLQNEVWKIHPSSCIETDFLRFLGDLEKLTKFSMGSPLFSFLFSPKKQ